MNYTSDHAAQPPTKVCPPHPSKQLYDASPYIKQLMRVIHGLKAQSQTLEEELLQVQVENEELEASTALLELHHLKQAETLASLARENAELQSKVASSPLSPCLKSPGSASKNCKVAFSIELATIVMVDQDLSPSKLPKHRQSVMALDGVDDTRFLMRELVRPANKLSDITTKVVNQA